MLERLYDGDVVRQVADHLGVTQHTVRTQVKSVMRKLEVNTQLARRRRATGGSWSTPSSPGASRPGRSPIRDLLARPT